MANYETRKKAALVRLILCGCLHVFVSAHKIVLNLKEELDCFLQIAT